MAGESKITSDHDEIRRWAEERQGEPARVKGTGTDTDVGMLRFMFAAESGGSPSGQALEPISWEDFFQKFDEKKLALLYQDRTSKGDFSRFFKLVRRK